MQRTFNGYKAVMIGVNLSGRGFQHGDSTELRELRENLQLANQKWAQACAALDSWEHRLHQALMECQVKKTTRMCFKHLMIDLTDRVETK